MATDITLNWYELFMAAQVGLRRHVSALRDGKQDRFGASDKNGWSLHIEGAAGEMAAAKALGMYWSGSVNTYSNGGDVGSVQVRTRSDHRWDLIVRPPDRDSDAFVLVTGQSPRFTVHGWILGRDAKNPDWLRDHGGRESAYFVPQSALNPIMSLREAA